MIFDETITGFRWHLGGAQGLYGVVPDMSIFGKGMANGFSQSALAGKREVMRTAAANGLMRTCSCCQPPTGLRPRR